jgi:tetratricopeptide (TPR) repeat protein
MPAEALQAHQKARTLLQKRARSATASNLSRDRILAESMEKTGLLLAASGKTAEALAACEEALAIRQKASDDQPTLAWARWKLANNHLALGVVQRRAGRPAQAVASFRSAIALIERLPTLTPRNHYGLACCHAQLAGVAAEAGLGLTAEQGVAEAERAMAALKLAYAGGFGIAPLLADVALDTLRPREDFRMLVREVEEKAAEAQRHAPPTGPK